MKTKATFRKTALAAMFIMLLAASCVVEPAGNGREVAADDAAVRLSLSVPAAKPATRGLSVTQEGNVNSVHVLAFDTSDKFLFYKPASNVVNTTATDKTFEVRLGMGTYNLVFVVNATAEISALNLDSYAGQSKSVLLPLIVKSSTGKWTSSAIPMWGYRNNVVISPTSGLTTDLESDPIMLARMLAKIDVEVSAAAAGKNAGVNKNFKLTSVRLYNYNTKGHIIPEPLATYWNPTLNEAIAPMPNTNGAVTGANNPLVYLVSSETGTYDGTNNFADQDGMHNVVYAFEAAAGAGGTSLPTNTCLVIGGSYKEGGDETSFYRVDFREIDGGTGVVTYLPLLRNYNYTIDINSVTGPGLPSAKEAFESVPVNFNATVTSYPADKGGQSVVYDGKNRMWLDRDIIFCGNEGTVAGVDIVVTINSTNTTEELTIGDIGFESGGTWLTAANYTKGTTISTTADGVSVKQTTITVRDIPAYVGGTAEREAYFWVQSGNMKYKYRIVQSHEPWLRLRDEAFLLDGTTQTIGVKAMLNWEAKIKDVAYNNIAEGKNLITKLVRNTGNDGTSELPIATYDDIHTGSGNFGRKEVMLTFTHEDYLSKDIPVTLVSGHKRSQSNSYMVDWSNPGLDLIPASQAARAFHPTDVTPATGSGFLPKDWITDADFKAWEKPLRAQVLWSDVDKFGTTDAVVTDVVFAGQSLDVAQVYVKQGQPYVASGVKGGNSLVILYKDNDNNGHYSTGDEIKWSWHIWNSEYNPGGLYGATVTKPASATSTLTTADGGKLYRFGGNNNNTWMDRNLGAIGGNVKPSGTNINKDYELGFLYQWGRKDPLPGASDGILPDGTTSVRAIYYPNGVPASAKFTTDLTVPLDAVGLQTATNNPHRHIHGSSNPYDWNSSTIDGQAHELWGQSCDVAYNLIPSTATFPFIDSTTGKSAYDPCPEGWRVVKGQGSSGKTFSPLNSMVGQAISDGYGYSDTTHGFWPVSGALSYNSLSYSKVGSWGYYWTSSPTSPDVTYTHYRGYSILIRTDVISSSNAGMARTNGFNIRCVAE